MDDLISRQEALDLLSKDLFGGNAERIIANMPAAPPRRLRGRWINEQLIPDDITGHVYGECSICGKLRIVDNFCPNCGARMMEGNT